MLTRKQFELLRFIHERLTEDRWKNDKEARSLLHEVELRIHGKLPLGPPP